MQPLPIIQSLWIGDRLSTMERLCISSFLYHGHSFHLYTYDHVENVPEGVTIKDANEILPFNMVFKCQYGSYAAFADIFRYKLLYDKGNYWVDTDIICLQPFTDNDEYIFASERLEYPSSEHKVHITNCLIKAPSGSAIMEFCYKQAVSKESDKLEWGEIGPKLMKTAVDNFNMKFYVADPGKFCPVNYWEWDQLIDGSIDRNLLADSKAVHLWNELWRRDKVDKSGDFDENSIYEWLKKTYFQTNEIKKSLGSKHDLVSIVIPCYNQAQYLEEAVRSAIGQTYSDIEIIIVNDGSPDNTDEIALKLQKKYPNKIQIITQKNSGLYAARDSGINKASGKYILPLDADDILDEEMLVKCTESMKKYNADIVYTGYKSFGAKVGTNKWRPFSESFPLYHTPCSATALYKRKIWEKVGGYKKNMQDGYEDWEFWVNAYKHGFTFQQEPKIFLNYRTKEESMYTEANKKDAYLKSKIVMNHPELYTVWRVQKSIETIKDTEKYADLYFYYSNKVSIDEKYVISLIAAHLSSNALQEMQFIDIPNHHTKIVLYSLDTLINIEHIQKLNKNANENSIVFYAPLKYIIPSLSISDFAWSKKHGVVKAQGTEFNFLFKLEREKLESQLLAQERLEDFANKKASEVTKQAIRGNKMNKLLEKQKDLIYAKDDLLEKRKNLMHAKDDLLEKRKLLIDTQTDKIQNKEYQLSRLMVSLKELSSIKFLSHPFQKIKQYKSLMQIYHKIKFD